MPVIFCQINPFDYNVSIQVLGSNREFIDKYSCALDEIYARIPALAKEYQSTKVILAGGLFGEGFVEEIQTEYALKYGKNDLEIEVL